MKKESIIDIENNITDGLTGYLYQTINNSANGSLFNVETLTDGSAALVLSGTAPVMERREQFLKIWNGCKEIAASIKRDVDYVDKVNSCCLVCSKYVCEEIGDSDYGAVYVDTPSCADYHDTNSDTEELIPEFDRNIERLCCSFDFWKVIEQDTELSQMFDSETARTDGNYHDTYKRFEAKYNVTHKFSK